MEMGGDAWRDGQPGWSRLPAPAGRRSERQSGVSSQSQMWPVPVSKWAWKPGHGRRVVGDEPLGVVHLL
jgi:hypothetical protein